MLNPPESMHESKKISLFSSPKIWPLLTRPLALGGPGLTFLLFGAFTAATAGAITTRAPAVGFDATLLILKHSGFLVLYIVFDVHEILSASDASLLSFWQHLFPESQGNQIRGIPMHSYEDSGTFCSLVLPASKTLAANFRKLAERFLSNLFHSDSHFLGLIFWNDRLGLSLSCFGLATCIASRTGPPSCDYSNYTQPADLPFVSACQGTRAHQQK